MSTYRSSVWRLLGVQALAIVILWLPIWVVFLQCKGLSLNQIGPLEALAWILTYVRSQGVKNRERHAQ